MKRTIALVFLFALAGVARAEVTVQDAWVRSTVPGQKVAGAYMKLSADAATRLVAVASPVAQSVEVHQMAMENGVAKMRAVPALEIPRGGSVELKPGGYHLMLFGLKKGLKDGDTVPITLKFQDSAGKAQIVELAAPVRTPGDAAQPGGGHDHH